MKVNVIMPQLGESVAEGTIVKWLKIPGDRVERDENILEISTDKVDSEIPAPAAGILVEILAQEGETIPVGQPIALIETEVGAAAGKEEGPAVPAEEKGKEDVEVEAATPTVPYGTEPGEEIRMVRRFQDTEALTQVEDRRFYSPLVRKMAEEQGISMEELRDIPGSGTGGRVTKNDMQDRKSVV